MKKEKDQVVEVEDSNLQKPSPSVEEGSEEKKTKTKRSKKPKKAKKPSKPQDVSKKGVLSNRLLIDVLIALIPVTIFALYRFGGHALLRLVLGVGISILAEVLIFPISQRASRRAETKWDSFKSRYKKFGASNILGAAVTGLIFTLMLPARINIYVLIMGVLFATIIGKAVFGGNENNIANPAMVGRIFVVLAFASFFKNAAYPGIDVIAGATPLAYVRQDGISLSNDVKVRYPILDLFLGNVPGAMGEVSILAILAGAIYLIIRKAADYRTMLGIIIPSAIFLLLVGAARFPGEAFTYMIYQLFAGGLFFAAVFVATDPVTSPTSGLGKLLYGLLIASFAVTIRAISLTGAMEGIGFAILFGNFITPLIDRFEALRKKFSWQFATTYGIVFVAMIFISYFAAGGKA